MAENDKVAFRREFRITESGNLPANDIGDGESFFIGNIRSLHVEPIGAPADIFVFAKVGRTGDWKLVKKAVNVTEVEGLDVSPWEYIKVNVTILTGDETCDVILFGYDTPPTIDTYVTYASERDHRMMMEMKQLITDIRTMVFEIKEYVAEIMDED